MLGAQVERPGSEVDGRAEGVAPHPADFVTSHAVVTDTLDGEAEVKAASDIEAIGKPEEEKRAPVGQIATVLRRLDGLALEVDPEAIGQGVREPDQRTVQIAPTTLQSRVVGVLGVNAELAERCRVRGCDVHLVARALVVVAWLSHRLANPEVETEPPRTARDVRLRDSAVFRFDTGRQHIARLERAGGRKAVVAGIRALVDGRDNHEQESAEKQGESATGGALHVGLLGLPF